MYLYLIFFVIFFLIYNNYFKTKKIKIPKKKRLKRKKKRKLKKKNIEKFNNDYPISNQVNIKVNNFDNIIDNYNLKRINNILEEVKNFANYNVPEIKFNQMNLPVTQSEIDLNKIQPIIKYLIDSINKIGKNLHKIKLMEIDNAMQYSTDIQSFISFRAICKYKIKVNNSFNLKNLNSNYKHPNIKHDLVILFELVSEKNGNEDNFFDVENMKSDKIYIKKISIIDIDSGKYLPGENIDDYDSFFAYSKIMSNKIVDNKYLENKKLFNQNEVKNLTKNIDSEEKLDLTIESFFK